jgi:hypothetical protein
MPWDTNPLYALLHESIYCQGCASEWAAFRVRNSDYAEAFDAAQSVANCTPVAFTGANKKQPKVLAMSGVRRVRNSVFSDACDAAQCVANGARGVHWRAPEQARWCSR